MTILIPMAVFVVSIVLGHSLARLSRWLWLAALGLMALTGLVWLWIEAQRNATGVDELTQMLFAPLFLVPALAGLVVGALAGFRKKQADDAADS